MSDETPTIAPALTPEEWSKKGGPLLGRFPLFWLDEKRGVGIPDAYEEWYADGRERHALAALCLHGMPFGFTHDEVKALVSCLPVEPDTYEETMTPPAEVLDMAYAVIDKLRALLPPEG